METTKNNTFAKGMNNLPHSFGLSNDKTKIFEFCSFGFITLSLAFHKSFIKLIDAWHTIESILVQNKGTNVQYASSFILNEFILSEEKKELTDANILKFYAEFNKQPVKFHLLEYLKDLTPSDLKEFVDSLNLGQSFDSFSHTETKKIGEMLEIKAEYDRDYVPAMLVSRNDFYDLLLTKTRDGYAFGMFPMLKEYKQREFKAERWVKEQIETMKELFSEWVVEVEERKERISKKAIAEMQAEEKKAEKSASFKVNFDKKIEHLQGKETAEKLTEAYNEARKATFAGNISKNDMVALNAAYKELLKPFEATKEATKQAEKQEKELLKAAKLAEKELLKAEKEASKQASKQPEPEPEKKPEPIKAGSKKTDAKKEQPEPIKAKKLNPLKK